MATKIRLMRLGKIRAPYYRIVVADSRTKRDGRVIETVGKYHPKENPSFIEVDSDRVQYWLGVGAQPTEPVAAILRKTGDWQKYKGEPAPPPLLQPEARPDRKAIFADAAREAAGLTDDSARRKAETRPRKQAATPAPNPATAEATAAVAEAPPAEAATAAAPASEAAEAPAVAPEPASE